MLTFEPNTENNWLMTYNWQRPGWGNFTYNLDNQQDLLYKFAEQTGEVTGMLKGLPPDIAMEALIDMMVAEAVKSSEIEGEYLNREDVMSSIRNNIGLNETIQRVPDKRAEGIGELMVDVRNSYADTLTQEKLFAWHIMLMRGSRGINAGSWRTHSEPMQVISGSASNPKVHFEAPPSQQVAGEMEAFIDWFNRTAPGEVDEINKAPVRAGIAHLYFESIHPFEDGNGRIGRAIAEKALSQGIGRPVLLSLSKTIEKKKKDYYNALEQAQSGNEITNWLRYFIEMTFAAQTDAEEAIGFTLRKVRLFDRSRTLMNERQLTVVTRMLDEGPSGFEGGMTAKKYMSIAKTSKATATRDLQDLVDKEILILFGDSGGRSTRYQVNI